MYLITRCFVAVSVVADMDGMEECATDADVVTDR